MRLIGMILLFVSLAIAGLYFMIAGLGGPNETAAARNRDIKAYLLAGALGTVGIALIMLGA